MEQKNPVKKENFKNAPEPAKKQEAKQHLKEEVKDSKKEIEELTNLLKRIQADFENYRKKVEQEKMELIDYAVTGFVQELLPLLDSFEAAMQNVKECDIEFLNGIKMIHSQLCKILEAHGLKCIECIGKEFDPYKHEALVIEESDKHENIITAELQKGYELKERILRPSRVKISKKTSKEAKK